MGLTWNRFRSLIWVTKPEAMTEQDKMLHVLVFLSLLVPLSLTLPDIAVSSTY